MTIEKKLLSIIIPSYNEEKDIGKCIESLKSQSYQNFEIIIVDDGSKDKTIEIVKTYSVNLIKGSHKGAGFSRNIGAKKAKGEILIFVDADMTFDKDYLKNLIKPLENENIIGTTHENEIAKNTDNVWSKCWGKIRVKKEDAENVKVFRAIRKNKFLEMGGFDPKYGYADDQTFWFKFKIKPFLAEKTICYHNNPETLNETYKQARWIGTSWKERFEIFKIWGINYLVLILFGLFLPFIVLLKAVKTKINGVYFDEKLRFYWYKFRGYFSGIKKAIIKGEVWK